MSHGLSSRAVVEQRVKEVQALAKLLTAGVPYTADVQKAAEAMADALFACHAIRRTRIDLLTPVMTGPSIGYVEDLLMKLDQLERYTESGLVVFGEMLSEDVGSRERNSSLLFETLSSNRSDLRAVDEYERKAHSRYLKLVTRLDYLMIEARRKR